MDNRPVGKAVSKMAVLAAVAAGVIMISTVVNSFGRYILDRNIPAVVEVNEFLLVVLAFTALGWTQYRGRHVNMDFVLMHLRPPVKKWVEIISNVVVAGMLVVMFIAAMQGTIASTAEREVMPSVIALPKWIFVWFIPVGSLGMLLVVLEDIVVRIRH